MFILFQWIYARSVTMCGSYGISGRVLSVFKSFLRGRSLKIVVNDHLSEGYKINAGVFQGPLLGAILFLVYINDLPKSESSVNIYSDDTTVYSFRSPNLGDQNLATRLSCVALWWGGQPCKIQ